MPEPIAPYARDDEQICDASMRDGHEEEYVWYCTAAAGHEPMDHAAYGVGGRLFRHWPVADD